MTFRVRFRFRNRICVKVRFNVVSVVRLRASAGVRGNFRVSIRVRFQVRFKVRVL